MESKIKVLPAGEVEEEIQPLLDKGWLIKSMVSEPVSSHYAIRGRIAIYLELPDKPVFGF